ncbi:hypothetical protein RRG08_060075 [Elysia crispata]|uniref:Uncharacterized protein n=1 Tax=Elysia crispata TaxID=231223 RepID=A0AAE0Y177_9GAST|nr:hypothetical protein RRG08_060075 [Elysia crispata]
MTENSSVVNSEENSRVGLEIFSEHSKHPDPVKADRVWTIDISALSRTSRVNLSSIMADGQGSSWANARSELDDGHC